MIAAYKGLLLLLFSFTTVAISAQVDQHVLKVESLQDSATLLMLRSEISLSQFVMIGEQHGIQEAGELTNIVYELAQPYGFNHLCIETDAVAAKLIEQFALDTGSLLQAKASNTASPFSIPFYNNTEDYKLFKNVVNNKGHIWGIDQTFMAQFRLNFNYLATNSSNALFRDELTKMRDDAVTSYESAISQKDFSKLFLFNYSDELHTRLTSLSNDNDEQDILNQLKETKAIYTLNFTGEHYQNNFRRSELMKQNFLSYYEEAAQTKEVPKVVFKLGANHIMRGLNSTNIYDVSNLVTGLATINQLKSTHIKIQGIKGECSIGNPFSPVPTNAFDNTTDFPKEVQELIADLEHKYLIIQLSEFRANAKSYSPEFQHWIFNYDIIVLVNEAKALSTF